MHLEVLDNLPPDPKESISLANLSERCHTDTGLLERVLRLPTSNNFVQAHPGGRFSHTAASLDFRTGSAGAKFLRTVCDEVLPTALILSRWLGKEDVRCEPQGTGGNVDNAFTFRDGLSGDSPFTIISNNPARSKDLHEGLDALNSLYPFTGFYDFEYMIERSLSSESARSESDTDQKMLVDVGGGSGAFLAQLLEDHPNVSPSHTVLQDLPHVIEMARHNPKLPAAVCLQAHDFFT